MTKCKKCKQRITKKEEEKKGKAWYKGNRVCQKCWSKLHNKINGRRSEFMDKLIKLQQSLKNG